MEIEMLKFQNKDIEAQKSVFQRFYPTMMFLVEHFLDRSRKAGEATKAGAEDLVFRCLTNVCKNPEKFDTIDKLACHLYTDVFYLTFLENINDSVKPYNDAYWNERYKTESEKFLQQILRIEVLAYYEMNPGKLDELKESKKNGTDLLSELLLTGLENSKQS